MNNDGFGQVGAGDSDMRVAGEDLQHSRQTRSSDSTPSGKVIRMPAGQGGPMKEALDGELARHKESKIMRLKDLQDHYQR